jgi:hypothetical protein
VGNADFTFHRVSPLSFTLPGLPMIDGQHA